MASPGCQRRAWTAAPPGWYDPVVVRRLIIVFGVLLLIEQLGLFAWAMGTHRIVQKDRAFEPTQIAIAAGDTLQFTNEDSFLHQIYVNAPKMTYESDEQPPGQSIELPFPTAGTFEVHCHIHPKMLLTVTVK
jgi:plastocyanin